MRVKCLALFAVINLSLCCSVRAQTYTRTETIEYSDNISKWVLGQVKSTSVDGVQAFSADYDPLTALPLVERSFGKVNRALTYYPNGTIATVADGNGIATALSGYKRGIPQLIKLPATRDQPSGSSISATVDDLGQITKITDPDLNATCYHYDLMGRTDLITYPSEAAHGQCGNSWNQTTITFKGGYSSAYGLPAGLWRQISARGNAIVETYFDGLWRPVIKETYDKTSKNDTLEQSVTRYDAAGRLAFTSYSQRVTDSAISNTWGNPGVAPNADGVRTLYDALDRPLSVAADAESGAVLTSTISYLSGFRTKTLDARNKATTVSFMAFDEPVTDWPVVISAPEGATQSIAWNSFGKPLSITQSGLYGTETKSITKKWIYDDNQRLCRTIEPETGSSVTSYDSADNVLWTADGLSVTGNGCGREQVASSGKTQRTYDDLNRLLTVAPPFGSSSAFAYDAGGNIATAVSASGSWSFRRNGLGLSVGETLQLPGLEAWTIGRTYDGNGGLSTIKYPDGKSVAYAPDALGRPTQVGSYATGISYFPNGEVYAFNYGNGEFYLAHQNTRELLDNFSYAKGLTLNLSEDVLYDNNANITAVIDRASGARSKTYEYDDLNRLTSAVASHLWGTEAYTYDPVNNLRSRSGNSTTITYSYDSTNRLIGMSDGTTFKYDSRGNINNKNGEVLTFDAQNQLLNVGNHVAYSYDAFGRRVSKAQVGGNTTYYLYSQSGQLMYQWEPVAAKATKFIYLGKRMVARDENTALGASSSIGFDANPSDGDVEITWGAVAAATSYTLQERAGEGAWTTIYSGTSKSKALTGKIGGSYQYRVEGCIGSTCGAWTTSATLGVRPAIPTVTVPSGVIDGTYTVSWIEPASATSYDVQERLNSGAWIPIATNTGSASITRPGTISGSYSYRVSAKNAYGTRGWAPSSDVEVLHLLAPSNVSFDTNPNDGSYTVSWGAVAGASSYTLQESANAGEWITVYTGSAASKVISGKAGGSYQYRAEGCAEDRCSAWTTSEKLGVRPALPSVTGPRDTVHGAYIVSWTTPSGTDSFDVQERFNGGSWVVLLSGTSATAVDRPGNAGAYEYRVSAKNIYGTRGWALSSVVLVGSPPVPTLAAPANSKNGSYVVSWTAVSGAINYALEEQVGSGDWAVVQTTDQTALTIAGKANGEYSYRVQACNSAGCSEFSVSRTTTVLLPPDAPATIDALSVVATGIIRVTWTASDTAIQYLLQEKINSGGWASVYTGSATSASLIANGTGAHTYQVQACNASGCSAFTASAAILVTIIPASAPALSVPSSSNTGSYTVSWTSVSNAESYELQQKSSGSDWSTLKRGAERSVAITGMGSGNYSYRVFACASGCGPSSAVESIVVTVALPGTPSAPRVDISGPSYRTIAALAWDATGGATSYSVEERAADGTTTVFYDGPNTSFAKLDNSASTSGYRVKACNAAGCSPYSAYGYGGPVQQFPVH